MLTKNDNEAGEPTGSTTDLHFTVLRFHPELESL